MRWGYIDTITKYFYKYFDRIRRNKSEKDKVKLKKLAKRDKEIAEELKPIQEQLKLLEEKESKLILAKEKILKRYTYEVRTRELNPNYTG